MRATRSQRILDALQKLGFVEPGLSANGRPTFFLTKAGRALVEGN